MGCIESLAFLFTFSWAVGKTSDHKTVRVKIFFSLNHSEKLQGIKIRAPSKHDQSWMRGERDGEERLILKGS